MARTRNRRRDGSLLSRLTNRVTRSLRRPSNTMDDVLTSPQPKPKPKPKTRRKARKTGRVTGSVKGNKRNENPVLVILLWLLPMAAAVAAFATPFLGARAYEYLMSTGHFMVREVIIAGTEQVDRPEILELAGIRAGTHVLASDLDAMARRIHTHPWIASAQVERELPDRLIVTIDEHRPVAHVVLDRLWLVNGSGEPFSEVPRTKSLDLPLITGVSAGAFTSDATDGERAMARADIRAAVNLARLYEEVGLANRWPVGEVRIEAGGRMTIVVSNLGTEAVLGTGPFRQKLYRLEWVLEKLHQDSKSADYVLLDGKGPTTGMRDDGKVVVASDLARTPAEIAEEAQRRAQIAKERDESLILRSGGEEEGEQVNPRPVSLGVRPAVGPVYLDEGEKEDGATLNATSEEE